MAVSLEVRPPLLDPELVGWGMALPAAAKLRGGVGKRVLREAASPLLPPALLQRRKRGFAADLQRAVPCLGYANPCEIDQRRNGRS